MRLIRGGIQGFVLLLLLGCGYQLSSGTSFQGVEISLGSGIDPAVLRLLQPTGRRMAGAGAEDDPALFLILDEENYQKFPIAAAAFDETTEFEVALQWVFSLKNESGEVLIDAERLVVKTHLARHNQSLVAASETEAALQAQLRSELASRLRYRLQPWLSLGGSK